DFLPTFQAKSRAARCYCAYCIGGLDMLSDRWAARAMPGLVFAAAMVAILPFLFACDARATVPPSAKCVAAKNNAGAKAFACLVNEQNKLLLGKASDSAKCTSALVSSFDKAELSAAGACPQLADSSIVTQRIGDAQSALFSAVQASSGITTKCITVKTKAAATYAQCAAKVASRLATGQLRGISPKTTVSYALFNYLKCVSKLGKVDDVCAFPVAAPELQALAAPAASYLRGANLSGSDLSSWVLTGADLQNAELVSVSLAGADLAGANMASADLTQVSAAGADLTDANMSSANLTGISARNLSGCPSSLPSSWVCLNGTL